MLRYVPWVLAQAFVAGCSCWSDGGPGNPGDSGMPDLGMPDLGPPGICGDGALGRGEVCDDGNTLPGDTCSQYCLIVLE